MLLPGIDRDDSAVPPAQQPGVGRELGVAAGPAGLVMPQQPELSPGRVQQSRRPVIAGAYLDSQLN